MKNNLFNTIIQQPLFLMVIIILLPYIFRFEHSISLIITLLIILLKSVFFGLIIYLTRTISDFKHVVNFYSCFLAGLYISLVTLTPIIFLRYTIFVITIFVIFYLFEQKFISSLTGFAFIILAEILMSVGLAILSGTNIFGFSDTYSISIDLFYIIAQSLGGTIKFLLLWNTFVRFLIGGLVIFTILKFKEKSDETTDMTHCLFVSGIISILIFFISYMNFRNIFFEIIIVSVVYLLFFFERWQEVFLVIVGILLLNNMFSISFLEDTYDYRIDPSWFPAKDQGFCMDFIQDGKKAMSLGSINYYDFCVDSVIVGKDSKIESCSGKYCPYVSYSCSAKNRVTVKYCINGCINGSCV